MYGFTPPIAGRVISDREHTFGTLRKFKECIIKIDEGA
jgi:hypothetical protein